MCSLEEDIVELNTYISLYYRACSPSRHLDLKSINLSHSQHVLKLIFSINNNNTYINVNFDQVVQIMLQSMLL